ncbi:MAG: HupE/UreJ family protein [Rubripirellula sp.]
MTSPHYQSRAVASQWPIHWLCSAARRTSIASSILLLVLFPNSALAHSVSERFGDFYGGMLHPLTAFEHLLAFIAIGLLAGQQQPKEARWILLAFPLGLLAGCLSAFWGLDLSIVIFVNRASFIVVGLLVATAWHVPLSMLVAIGLLLGITHGYENGLGVTDEMTRLLYLPGVVLAGLLLVAIVAGATVSRHAGWQQIAIRVVGSWIAAIGILMLGLV